MAKHLYYHLKPYLPWRLRMSMRSLVAGRKRKIYSDVWPINEAAGTTPEGWPGWPEGKKFAFVITHDIEGSNGLAKCRQLMQLEKDLGFRSTFNFIPEGGYTVSPELRQELVRNGFEVGVHDLRHDGKLYWSREVFAGNAQKINGYLKDWGAKGFRSGFMLHNLDWIHDLNIRYDTSTFDTDPFEPQPEGVNTIFPFWVSGANGSGYVEMPYTLPQDSTLFLVLKEKTIDIWKKKLDWVVKNGGMAFLPVHPDYLNFEDGVSKSDEFSWTLYREFLQHVAQKFKGQYWHGTLGEMAEWYRGATRPAERTAPVKADHQTTLKGKSAAVVLYSYYPADPRPRREAEALANAGVDVELLCLRQGEEPVEEIINGVRVRRLPITRRRDGKLTYMMQYGSFISMSFFILLWRTLWKKYDLVHVHNMPDVLVFSALGPKLRGARVILDLHDPMPELMRTIFGMQENSKGVRLLKWLEKLSIGFADQVVTVNLACKKIFSARSCQPEKIQVVMNAPDEKIFAFHPFDASSVRNESKPFVIMYHGSIVERHGLDLAVQALQSIRKKIPNAELRIYGGSTPYLESVMANVRKEGLQDAVKSLGSHSLEQIVKAIKECDIGVIPNRRSIFTEINTPTRIFEYLSVGKPVIAPRASGITDYFSEEELIFFELGDAKDLAVKMEYAYFHPGEVEKIVERGQEVYLRHCWTREKQSFVNRVTRLLTPWKLSPLIEPPLLANGVGRSRQPQRETQATEVVAR